MRANEKAGVLRVKLFNGELSMEVSPLVFFCPVFIYPAAPPRANGISAGSSNV